MKNWTAHAKENGDFQDEIICLKGVFSWNLHPAKLGEEE